MTTWLVLHLDAPMMSFGGVAVDARGASSDHPGLSLIGGMLANAMGFEHRDAAALQRLQARLVLASRCDVPGRSLVDYQTVFLGQPHLVGTGWTTRGSIESRAGAFSLGTHIRQREYLAGALYTVVVTLQPADEVPGLDDLERALNEPERPLFIGRKSCLPARPIFGGRVEAATPRAALLLALRPARSDLSREATATLWTPSPGTDAPGDIVPAHDMRDWSNQLHTGQRWELVEHDVEVPGGN